MLALVRNGSCAVTTGQKVEDSELQVDLDWGKLRGHGDVDLESGFGQYFFDNCIVPKQMDSNSNSC